MRAQLQDAALVVFAERGYGGATMAAIALEAGVSTGNIYRYFENKDALFEAVVTDALVAEFLALVRDRVRALSGTGMGEGLNPRALTAESALLEFWIRHRLAVVILLEGAEGSRHEGFAARFADELLGLALSQLRERAGGRRLRPVVRSTLQQIFENTVRFIAAILRAHASEAAIRDAFRAFWSYQLGGLWAFEKWVLSDEH